MKKRLILKSIIYLLIGLLFFLEMVNFIKFPIFSKTSTTSTVDVNTIEQNTTNKLVSLKKIYSNQIEQELYLEFNIKSNITQNQKEIEIRSFNKNWLIDRYIFFDYILNNNNSVIPLIYFLILIAFLVQVLLLAWSSYYSILIKEYGEKKLDTIFLYGSEWSVNVPPVLGVVGTIFSFAMVVGNLADISSLSTVFKDNFSNAALTTILGGNIYVVNLFLNIFIAKNLSSKEK